MRVRPLCIYLLFLVMASVNLARADESEFFAWDDLSQEDLSQEDWDDDSEEWDDDIHPKKHCLKPNHICPKDFCSERCCNFGYKECGPKIPVIGVGTYYCCR